ncbi:MAG: mannose-1-phosphate guanylyltransferase/mannose-6-phosphate isomerase [Candidatus Aureabacteria bacterium]|nr:mannose-1-phosphate guanylyltransferase/mannose-6-phosphate isomerase [Candidatus Auribacterota bacterium]
MKVIILAGGKGEGLWPLSRKDFPKQFMEINAKSFFYQAVKRALLVSKPEEIFVSTGKDYFFTVRKVLQEFSIPEENIIIEPLARNTAPALLLSVFRILKQKEAGEKDIVLVCPSDQHIREAQKFSAFIKSACRYAKKGKIVIFGVRPLMPLTDYGYIKKGKRFFSSQEKSEPAFDIEKFIEKPSEEKVTEFVRDESWYWNTGMLLFQVETILQAFKKFVPDIFKILRSAELSGSDALSASLKRVPSVSIDRAILEKEAHLVLVPAPFRLLDINDWNVFYKSCPKDKDQNVFIGDVVATDMRSSLVICEKGLIACSGMSDVTVVGSDDVVFVSSNKDVSKVKKIVSQLNKKGRKEAVERTTSYRPWGSYTILESGPRYKIKRLVVNPGESLSLQLHNSRSEHWVVIRGIAKVRIGEEVVLLQEGESTFVPVKSLHQLQNPGKKALEIIEVQLGDYIGEDDIRRFEDKYGREKL